MSIPKATIEAIRDRTDIAEVVGRHVKLLRKGRSLVGLCPFHQEKTPSFNVVESKSIYHCFGCGVGGDVFKFLMQLEGLSFVEAIKELAGPAGIQVEERELTPQERQSLRTRATLYEVCEEGCRWFHNNLMTHPSAQLARDYLDARGMTRATLEQARLGYAPDQWNALLDHLHGKGIDARLAIAAGLARLSSRTGNAFDFLRHRVIFPIFDSRDRPIAFGGRVLEGDGPKYLNTPESDIYEKSRVLYGLSWARQDIQRRSRALVVEGYFDVLSLLQAGFGETVATCGTSLTKEHVQQLRRFTTTVVALFDEDEAGLRAAERSLPMFLDAGVEALQLSLPGAKDPDEYIQSNGAKAFESRLRMAVPLLELVVRRAAERHGTTPGGRQRAVADVVPLLRKLPAVLQSDLLIRTCDLLGVAEDLLRREIGRPPSPRRVRRDEDRSRWVGNDKLNHLLWLLLHFPEHAVPQVRDRGTGFLSDREDVRWAVFQLVEGIALTSLLEELEDPDVVRVFQATAAKADLYTEDQALDAARQVMDRLEVEHLEGQVLKLRRELSTLDILAEREAFHALGRERMLLQNRLAALGPRAAQGRSGTIKP
jgi:DNA primase